MCLSNCVRGICLKRVEFTAEEYVLFSKITEIDINAWDVPGHLQEMMQIDQMIIAKANCQHGQKRIPVDQ